jgi:hypothetical protein
MSNFSFLLNLQKEKIPGITHIKKIPDIETLKTDKFGTLYAVKYFVSISSSKPRMIRFTSKEKNFDTLFSFDIFDDKFRPIGFKGNYKPDKEKFLKVLASVLYKVEKKRLNEGAVGDSIAAALAGVAPLLFLLTLSGIVFMVEWWRVRTVDKLEDDINDSLFEGHKKDEPAYAIYGKLTSYLENVIKGNYSSLIICGPPGTSKTYVVRRTLHFLGKRIRDDYMIAKGSTSTLADTYYLLYKNRDKILILDDFDSPLRDESMINFLKSITDTYKHRILSFPREKTTTVGSQEVEMKVPPKFSFTGKLIIITNLEKKEIDKALLSRAPAVEVKFNAQEVFDNLIKMMTFIAPSVSMDLKMEVYNYILELYKKNPHININFRGFQNAVDARIGIPEHWQEMVRTIVEFD